MRNGAHLSEWGKINWHWLWFHRCNLLSPHITEPFSRFARRRMRLMAVRCKNMLRSAQNKCLSRMLSHTQHGANSIGKGASASTMKHVGYYSYMSLFGTHGAIRQWHFILNLVRCLGNTAAEFVASCKKNLFFALDLISVCCVCIWCMVNMN